MGLAATVYAEQLYTYGYGHPLWCPEPRTSIDGRTQNIQLGDVGYIDTRGGFRRLFNVTVDSQHGWNSGGVPVGFSPLVFNQDLRCMKEQALDPGPLCSEGVESQVMEACASANISGLAASELSYTFKCQTHCGAFLILKDHATDAWIEPNDQFEEYMLQNHQSWYAFATDPQTLGIRCEKESIVLVRGTVKTSAWTVGAFLGKFDRTQSVSLGAQLGTIGGGALKLSSERARYHKCEQRNGPLRSSSQYAAQLPHSESCASQPSNPLGIPLPPINSPSSSVTNVSHFPKDQCVFLSFYKIKYRVFLPKKITANADPSSMDPSPDHGDGEAVPSMHVGTDADIVPETPSLLPRTALDDVLDYILETSTAEVALASDADVLSIFSDRQRSSSFSSYLKELQPKTYVDPREVGRIAYSRSDGDLAVPSHKLSTPQSTDAMQAEATGQPAIKLLVRAPREPKKKPVVACLFCRERKIPCGHPAATDEDRRCNQCRRRDLDCVFPKEYRRGGEHKRSSRLARVNAILNVEESKLDKVMTSQAMTVGEGSTPITKTMEPHMLGPPGPSGSSPVEAQASAEHRTAARLRRQLASMKSQLSQQRLGQ